MTEEATTSEEVIKVGEQSAYKSVEELIKGKAEADKYIAQLTESLKEKDTLIAELQQKGSIVDELKQIREKGMENTNTPNVTEEAIKEIALKAMQESTAIQTAANNLASCKEALGKDVDLALKNKAQELGCSVEYLEGIAKTSPKAFKSMFGIKDAVSFESVNFLQSSRQVSQEPSTEPIDLTALKNPRAMAEFFNKASKDPSVLTKLKTW